MGRAVFVGLGLQEKVKGIWGDSKDGLNSKMVDQVCSSSA